ncbi:hypothetical protein GW17_00047274 [Ensete ventricosum]|nr:hypothetical protein GW17_00047274 [Ensete ventricosum]
MPLTGSHIYPSTHEAGIGTPEGAAARTSPRATRRGRPSRPMRDGRAGEAAPSQPRRSESRPGAKRRALPVFEFGAPTERLKWGRRVLRHHCQRLCGVESGAAFAAQHDAGSLGVCVASASRAPELHQHSHSALPVLAPPSLDADYIMRPNLLLTPKYIEL